MVARTQKFSYWHLLWLIPVLWILFLTLNTYYHTNYDSYRSAKPEADKLLEDIKGSGGTIVHTYNRSAFGWLNEVSSPSYEYYIEYNGMDTEKPIQMLAESLRKIGYSVETSQYTVDANGACQYYEFSNNGSRKGDDFRKQCQDTTGANDPELFGFTDNDGEPYHTLYATSDYAEVQANASNRTFQPDSNDFWSEEYAKEHNIESGRVPTNKTMLTIFITANHEVDPR